MQSNDQKNNAQRFTFALLILYSTTDTTQQLSILTLFLTLRKHFYSHKIGMAKENNV